MLTFEQMNSAISSAAHTVYTKINCCAHTQSPELLLKANYPALIDWLTTLPDTKKQKLCNLICWLKFSSQEYGVDVAHDHPITGKSLRFPVNEDTSLRYIRHLIDASAFSKSETITNILAHDLFNISTNTNLTDALLEYIQASEATHKPTNEATRKSTSKPTAASTEVKKISVENFKSHCLGHPFSEWPVSMKPFIFYTMNLRGADFSEENFYDIELEGPIIFYNCTFENTNFQKSKVRDISMEDCNCIGMELNGAKWEDIKWKRTSLKCADMTDAKIKRVNPWGADFKEATLKDTKITLTDKLDFKSETKRNKLLNHLDHPFSLLTAIRSIPIEYTLIKYKLITDIIESLVLVEYQGLDISKTYESFKDVLLDNWIYKKFLKKDYAEEASKHPVLTHFIYRLLEDELQKDIAFRRDNNRVDAYQPYRVDLLVKYIIKNKLNVPNWAVQNGLYLNLLIHDLQKKSNRRPVDKLRNAYLKHPDIAPLVSDYCNQKEHPNLSELFILMSDDKQEGIFFKEKVYEYFLDPKNISTEPPTSEEKFLCVYHADKQAPVFKNLYETLKPFPVLLDKYLDKQNKRYISGFINLLKLEEYEAPFKQAIETGQRPKRFSTSQNQKSLKDILVPLMVFNKPSQNCNESSSNSSNNFYKARPLPIDQTATIRTEHLNDIMQNYLPLIVNDDEDQDRSTQTAQVLFALSTLFTWLASDKFFGPRNVEPYARPEEFSNASMALRQYAVALLNEAFVLDPELFEGLHKKIQEQKLKDQKNLSASKTIPPTVYEQNIFDGYLNQLTIDRIDDLSNVRDLSNRMLKDAKEMGAIDPSFQKIFNMVFPREWLKILTVEIKKHHGVNLLKTNL